MKRTFETPTGSTGTFRPPVCRGDEDCTHTNGECDGGDTSGPDSGD